MSKRDRWLTSFALIASVLPIVLMAFIIKALPETVPVIQFELDEGFSKYNNLMVILFAVVPLMIIVFTMFIRKRDDGARIVPMLCVAIGLGLIFSVIVLYGGIIQIHKVEIVNNFDYLGFISVLLALTCTLLSNILRYRKPGNKFAINNKYTRASIEVWGKAQSVVADVQSILFFFIGIILAFIKGWIAIIILVVSLIVFFVWIYIISYFLYKKYMEANAISKI